jgi:hypothetical protein
MEYRRTSSPLQRGGASDKDPELDLGEELAVNQRLVLGRGHHHLHAPAAEGLRGEVGLHP